MASPPPHLRGFGDDSRLQAMEGVGDEPTERKRPSSPNLPDLDAGPLAKAQRTGEEEGEGDWGEGGWGHDGDDDNDGDGAGGGSLGWGEEEGEEEQGGYALDDSTPSGASTATGNEAAEEEGDDDDDDDNDGDEREEEEEDEAERQDPALLHPVDRYLMKRVRGASGLADIVYQNSLCLSLCHQSWSSSVV
jgi:hypothetical protein